MKKYRAIARVFPKLIIYVMSLLVKITHGLVGLPTGTSLPWAVSAKRHSFRRSTVWASSLRRFVEWRPSMAQCMFCDDS